MDMDKKFKQMFTSCGDCKYLARASNPTDYRPGRRSCSSSLRTTSSDLHKTTSTSTLSSCSLTSRTFVFPPRTTLHTIDLGACQALPTKGNLYLGTHVRHLRPVDNCEDDFSNGILASLHPRLPISRTLGFLPNFRSFGLSFDSTGAN